jgi:hypothetical protein
MDLGNFQNWMKVFVKEFVGTAFDKKILALRTFLEVFDLKAPVGLALV